MSGFWLFVILLINGGISWWNAYVCGSVWAETKALGGFMRVVVWCGAIQSAIGFSMIAIVGLSFAASGFGWLPAEAIKAMMNLWYLLIIVPALGSGLILTVHSWIVAYRDRDLASMGTAAWNTFTSVYNTYHAIDGIGDAFSSVTSFSDAIWDSDDPKSALIWVMVGLVALALASGVLLTYVLIQKYAGTRPLPARSPARA